jgi:oxalate decarboxylase/phosphoglucose isomerase-like protein (cupin superfamily)
MILETPEFKEWLASRPTSVQALYAEFPLGDTVEIPGESNHVVIGYTENDMLIVAPIWPGIDYDAAMAAKKYVCAKHYRQKKCG